MKVFFTEQAEASLNEIVLFIAQDNPDYAIVFVEWLVNAVTTSLEAMPFIGAPYTEETRYFVKKQYVFLYIVGENTIEILDVFRSWKNWRM